MDFEFVAMFLPNGQCGLVVEVFCAFVICVKCNKSPFSGQHSVVVQ